MEEKKYRSGFERYQDIAEMTKQECLKLEGKAVNRRYSKKTLYQWNGFKVFMADGEVEICDNDEKFFLAVYNNSFDRSIQFGLSDYDFNFTGVYYPKLTDSFVDSRYQKIESHLASEGNDKSDIHLLPDKISIIVQNEIKEAEGMDYNDEDSKKNNAQYIEQLKSALEFFEKVQELAKSEKNIEEYTEDLSSTQPTGAERIIEFMKQNNLEPHDLALALSMTLARTTDKNNAEKHIAKEVDRGKEDLENTKFEL